MTALVMGVLKVQQELDLRREKRGGKRKGSGRKPKGARASERHKARAEHKRANPVHVTIRIDRSVGRMRKPKVWRAVRVALVRKGWAPDFRICHVSIQGTHLHLIVEADSKTSLARGMQRFGISAAKCINDVLDRRGQVWADRYHPTYLTSPRQVRTALAYVLNNWRKHKEDRGRRERLDPYSTAPRFEGWIDEAAVAPTPTLDLLPSPTPSTWLLREGWKRHGSISPWQCPPQRP